MENQVNCGAGLILEPRLGGCLDRSEAEWLCDWQTCSPWDQTTRLSHPPPQLFLAKILLGAPGINPLERLNRWRSLAVRVM